MEEPKLEDYGITKEQLDYIESKKRVYEDKIVQSFSYISLLLGLVAGSILGIYFVLQIEFNSLVYEIFSIIVSIFLFGGVIGGAGGFMLGTIISIIGISLCSFIFSRNPLYQKAKQYEKAKAEYKFWWIRTQNAFWSSLSGRRFEQELALLYSKLGYKVLLTPTTDDKGIDIVLYKDDKKTIIQCKAHQKPVGSAVAGELYGTLISSKADEAILASISGFTAGVKEFVRDKPIRLIALQDIIHLQKKSAVIKSKVFI